MKLYDLIKRLSSIITPQSDDFYEYVLHTSDDNGGFLRTRYCWWDECIKNRTVHDEYSRVLVTAKSPIDIDELHNRSDTNVKLQIHYARADAEVKDADWDVEIGYRYVYIFDLENDSYTMKYIKDPQFL